MDRIYEALYQEWVCRKYPRSLGHVLEAERSLLTMAFQLSVFSRCWGLVRSIKWMPDEVSRVPLKAMDWSHAGSPTPSLSRSYLTGQDYLDDFFRIGIGLPRESRKLFQDHYQNNYSWPCLARRYQVPVKDLRKSVNRVQRSMAILLIDHKLYPIQSYFYERS